MTKETNITKLETVEPKSSYNFHITLDNYARVAAEKMLLARELPIRDHFDGPIFEDILGYQMGSEWVAVSLKDGTTYVYPRTSIARIKHYITPTKE